MSADISMLPVEILAKIFLYLSYNDLIHLKCVNKQFKRLVDGDTVFRSSTKIVVRLTKNCKSTTKNIFTLVNSLNAPNLIIHNLQEIHVNNSSVKLDKYPKSIELHDMCINSLEILRYFQKTCNELIVNRFSNKLTSISNVKSIFKNSDKLDFSNLRIIQIDFRCKIINDTNKHRFFCTKLIEPFKINRKSLRIVCFSNYSGTETALLDFCNLCNLEFFKCVDSPVNSLPKSNKIYNLTSKIVDLRGCAYQFSKRVLLKYINLNQINELYLGYLRYLWTDEVILRDDLFNRINGQLTSLKYFYLDTNYLSSSKFNEFMLPKSVEELYIDFSLLDFDNFKMNYLKYMLYSSVFSNNRNQFITTPHNLKYIHLKFQLNCKLNEMIFQKYVDHSLCVFYTTLIRNYPSLLKIIFYINCTHSECKSSFSECFLKTFDYSLTFERIM